MNARVKEQRAFWAARDYALLNLFVHKDDRAEIEAMIWIKTGERLTQEVKSIINVRDFQPFIHRKFRGAKPSLTDIAQLRRDIERLKSPPTRLKKDFADLQEVHLEMVDYDRICERDGETDFEIAQAFCLRYALSYVVAGNYRLLRNEVNDRPTKAPEIGQHEVFDTEPRTEFLEAGDGEDADGPSDV